MPKKLIKKSTIKKVAAKLFSRPKKSIKLTTKEKQFPIIQIGSGSKLIFSPEGTEFAQQKIKKIYRPDEKVQWFSITPKNQYQIDNNWPDAKEFVNVNTLGSIYTSQDNWLGYIGAWDDDEKQSFVVEKLLQILKTKRPLLAGKIVKETNGEYRIIFFVSRTELEKATL